MQTARLIALIAGAVMWAGCTGDRATDDDGPVIGLGFAQCEGRTPGGMDSSEEIVLTINALVPSAVDVHCTDKHMFALDERAVQFTYVVYGEIHDCPAGCFSSNLCAIVDNAEVSLYSARWLSGEVPLSIPPDCPELAGAAGGDTIRECENAPSGFFHPLTQTNAFNDFRDDQGREEWRFCF